MLYFILLLLVIQAYTLVKIFHLSKINKNNKEKKEEGKFSLAKIPKITSYKDVEPDYKTFYNFMENIKLEEWKSTINIEYVTFGSGNSWDVTLSSHDQKSMMKTRLRDYGDGVFLSNCIIRSNDVSLSLNREDEIANDIILFSWNYVIEHYESQNSKLRYSYTDTIKRINSQLTTLNRSKKLDNILD